MSSTPIATGLYAMLPVNMLPFWRDQPSMTGVVSKAQGKEHDTRDTPIDGAGRPDGGVLRTPLGKEY
jgi:hypothetical protein